uniref:Uncharacterized protein n=1 Tax=Arundo donax TaxID=35708 RepID=A0A0A9BEF7_ARUDO
MLTSSNFGYFCPCQLALVFQRFRVCEVIFLLPPLR